MLAQLDYQEEAIDALAFNYERGVHRQAGIVFTGGGKTSGIAAHLPRRFDHLMRRQGIHGGLLFIVHRREILLDAAKTFQEAYPTAWIGIEMGDLHAVGDEDMIFASADSIGTLVGNRIIKLKHRIFGIVITDEAHHLTTDSKWDNILNVMGVGSDDTQRLTLPDGSRPLSVLLTATPNRTDGKGLAPFLDRMPDGSYAPAFEFNFAWGVRNGWVVDVRSHYVVDESGVTGKEFADTTEIDFLVRVVRDFCRDTKTLVFTRSVPQSAQLAEALNRLGIVQAAHIDGTTDPVLRGEMLARYREMDGGLMSNFGVFTEGTNIPNIQTILMNRPVKSPVLFPQMVGRVTRPHSSAGIYTLKTAAERLAAIAASPKPYGTLICAFPPEAWGSLSVVAALTGVETSIVPQGGQSVTEIVDVIEYVEETAPEMPVHEIKSLDDLKVRLAEVDVWTQTVYNDDLKALSPLAWVQRGEDLCLHLPSNPFSDKAFDQVPVVVHFARMPNGEYEKRVVEVGGWNAALGRPRRADVNVVGTTSDVKDAVRKLEKWMRTHAPTQYAEATRGTTRPARAEDLKYLRRNKVSFAPDITDSTARLLVADHRVKTALTNVAA